MRTEKEILLRAVNLILLYGRVRAELGQPSSGRQDLLDFTWEVCRDLGYEKGLTEKEHAFMFSPLGSVSKETVFDFADQYEAVYPLLWSIGLHKDKVMRSYDLMETYNYVELLKLCDKHGIDAVAAKFPVRPIEEIEKQKAIAGILCIRAAFMNDKRFLRKHRSAQKLFTELLAPQYRDLVQEIPHRKGVIYGDFLIKNKPVYALTDDEFGAFDAVAVGRYRALDWVASDKEWGDFEFPDHMFVFRASKQ